MHESEPFVWAGKVPAARTWRRAARLRSRCACRGGEQLAAVYLRLGFHHIVPRGRSTTSCSCWACSSSGSPGASCCRRPRSSRSPTRPRCSCPRTASSACRAAIVEPAIALSIAFIAIENVLRPRAGPRTAGRRVWLRADPRPGFRQQPERHSLPEEPTSSSRCWASISASTSGSCLSSRCAFLRGGLVPQPSLVSRADRDPVLAGYRRGRAVLGGAADRRGLRS